MGIYNFNEMRKLGAQQFAFAFTEELVHHFWRLEDEAEAKMKVIEILQLTEPCITREYVKDWGLNWK